MPDVVRIGNTLFSWTSTTFKIDGEPYEGIVSLDHEQKRERKLVHGMRQNGKPIGRTSGKYSVPTCTMKVLKDTGFMIKTYLTGVGLGSYGDAEFGFQVGVSEPIPLAPGLIPMTYSASGVAIVGEKDGYEEGIDELLTEFELSVMSMTENGMQLWSVLRSLGSP